MNNKIIIVEDEEDLLDLLEYNLSKEGLDVIGFLDTKLVTHILEEERIDLIIMDRNLPGIEGTEYIQSIRDNGIQTPVIYLTAKDKDSEIEEGFLSGGDDYMTKPFNMKELIFRVKSILKRTVKNISEGTIRHKELLLDLDSRTLFINENIIKVTKLEFDLLYELILNKNIILDRDYLLQNVWKNSDQNQYKTVNVAMTRLKEKIDPDKTKNYIKSIRGIGYQFI
ncbi:MAG: two-component system alkaline phosphatase synthesis response regulator PhoP [Sulfurimonas sp.]|jgi:two-component system alkaline phosphatase synthesis response regulator PhoP|uniref:response regulator transcription factor n=1 Tax=Sulfurimonas sp. TaxID=2022749 RepID=UPI0039E37EE5